MASAMAFASSTSSSSSSSTAGSGVESSLYCNSCGISLDSAAARGVHYRSEWHRYNLKRRCAGMSAIGERTFLDQLHSLHERKQNQISLSSVRKCEFCHSSFNSLSAFQIHLKSKKHLKRENYKKERNNSDKEKDEQTTEQQTEEEEQDEDKEEQQQETSSQTPAAATIKADSTLSTALRQVRFADEKSNKEDDESEGGEDEEFTGEPIAAGTCLFCSTEFGSDYDACLGHMLKRHGFFVPFLVQLKDKEGFLTYLGAKIGTGNFCIYCLSRFPDQSAVQQHMNAKNHCKIRLEDEEDEEEIMEFFHFEDEQTATKEENNHGRRPVSVNAMGELILSDGSIVGTRDLKRYYKQNLRNTPPTNTNGVSALPAGTSGTEESSSAGSDALQNMDSSKQQVVLSSVHPRQLHGRALESKYLRKLQRVALRVNLASNKQKHFRKSTP